MIFYEVNVWGVDGETSLTIVTKNPKEALSFLKKNDHEGSVVTMNIEIYDSEKVYKLLEKGLPK